MSAGPDLFVVFSLPRSRSTWLSVLLSGAGRICGHDIGIECGSAQEFIDTLLSLGGTCETGAAFAWPLIRHVLPHARLAVVLRYPSEVLDSLKAIGIEGVEDDIAIRTSDLLSLSNQYGVYYTAFEELSTYGGCSELYRFCTGEELDINWWKKLSHTNIQVDLPWQISRLRANAAKLEGLKSEVRNRIDALRRETRAMVG